MYLCLCVRVRVCEVYVCVCAEGEEGCVICVYVECKDVFYVSLWNVTMRYMWRCGCKNVLYASM